MASLSKTKSSGRETMALTMWEHESIKWEICESRGNPWYGLLGWWHRLVCLVSWTVHLALLAIKPELTGLCLHLYNITATLQTNTYFIFVLPLCNYLWSHRGTESFSVLLFKFFVNKREQLSSNLSDQLLAKMGKDMDFKSSTIADFLHFINFFFSFPYWNSQPFDSTHVVEGAQNEMESKQTSLISEGFRSLYKAILLR